MNGDELLSDSYEIREVNDAVYEVDCEMVKPDDLNSISQSILRLKFFFLLPA